MGEEKKATTEATTAEVLQGDAPKGYYQDVPLGGQPVRATVSHEDREAARVEHEPLVSAAWDRIMKAMRKELEACPDGRSRACHELRNHLAVWIETAQVLSDKIK